MIQGLGSHIFAQSAAVRDKSADSDGAVRIDLKQLFLMMGQIGWRAPQSDQYGMSRRAEAQHHGTLSHCQTRVFQLMQTTCRRPKRDIVVVLRFIHAAVSKEWS